MKGRIQREEARKETGGQIEVGRKKKGDKGRRQGLMGRDVKKGAMRIRAKTDSNFTPAARSQAEGLLPAPGTWL